MTRVSRRSDQRWFRSRTPLALGWIFFLLAMLFCCSATSASAAGPVAAGSGTTAVRAFTPVPGTAFEPVVLASPGDRGLGTSCHGGSTHSVAVVLPVSSAPAALPSPAASAPAVPLTGAAAIRGPAHDGVRSVDQLRLQVQRV